MELKRHLESLAHYHEWATRRLHFDLARLPDTDYRRDCGLFFRSIHRTLNHLLLAERLWHGRFAGQPFHVARLDEELHADREAVRDAMLQQCGMWPPLVASFTAQQLDGDLTFISTERYVRATPLALTVVHVFNHGTHHRGQISAALTAMGHSAPELDLYVFLLDGHPDAGELTAKALQRALEQRFSQLNDEVVHCSSPTDGSDARLVKLVEQRAEVLRHLRRLDEIGSLESSRYQFERLLEEVLASPGCRGLRVAYDARSDAQSSRTHD